MAFYRLAPPLSNGFQASAEAAAELNRTKHDLRDTTVIPWNGPWPIFAQFLSNERENQAKVAWAEIFLLAQAARLAVCQRTPSFYRYFPEEDAGYVDSLFKYILGANGKGPIEVANKDWPLRVLYGSQPSSGMNRDDCVTDNSAAIFYNWVTDRQGPLMLICPGAFIHHARGLLAFRCNEIAQVITPEIALSLGTVILHELSHWNVLSLKAMPALNLRIIDYGYGFYGERIANDGNPTDGYGAYNAMQLNRNRNPDVQSNKQPTKNADSWMFFALEAYWSRKCGIQFQDPANPDFAVLPPPTDFLRNFDNNVAGFPPAPLNPAAPAFSPGAPLNQQSTPSTSV